MSTIQHQQARLAMHGSIIMVLGLLAAVGLSVAAALDRPDYGSWKFAHLEGVLNSLMVLAVAGVWPRIHQNSMATVGRVLLVVGGYCNIIGPLITAMFIGHRVLEPHTPLEAVVVYAFYIPGCLPLISFIFFAYGFYRYDGRASA